MASTKKKTTAKRISKPQTRAAAATASVAKSVASKQADWAKQSANEWQKGANEWAKQSAKLYQLPFAGGDASEVTRQAAEQVKTATQSFVRAGNDMMNQMFGGADPMAQWNGMFSNFSKSLPGADNAAETMQRFARESAEQMARGASSSNRLLNESMELARENAEAMVECSNIAITVSKEIGAELISYTNKTFSQNVELGKQLLSCRTLNDMFDLSSKFMKTNMDSFFSESVKLSEKLFQCATDVSEPLNERLSETSERLSKAVAA